MIIKGKKRILILALCLMLAAMAGLTGCQNAAAAGAGDAAGETVKEALQATASVTRLDASDLFTDRDLEQTPDLTDAVYETIEDGQTLKITEEGIYVISGTASEAQIVVEAAEEAKVQLVLDGVTITNTDSPCIYVKSADKVFVTTGDSENTLTVTGAFTADGDTDTDAVIFSKEDLVLNGTGTLTIESTDNGVVSKDDLKVTGGTYAITCAGNGLEANDSVAIADGSFTIRAENDGLKAKETEDAEKGYVYIGGGSFDIEAGSDGVQAKTILQVDGGDMKIKAGEGLESTQVVINDGTIAIDASDDGINGTQKSTAYTPAIEINGGKITIAMAQGDTDALDVNGDLIINGGTVDITAQFAFDFDGAGQLNGGTVTVNGEKVTEITNSMMMDGGFGGQGGFPGGQPPEGQDSQGFDPDSGTTGEDGFMPPQNGSGNESTDGQTRQRPAGKGGPGNGQPPQRPDGQNGQNGQYGQPPQMPDAQSSATPEADSLS
ncbi:MAG: carbohydrate-binding domain-containing protein [Firmicutes bacterium]|nr:carbohydrate-binding domain-containing protein [Bacillota bacterium]